MLGDFIAAAIVIIIIIMAAALHIFCLWSSIKFLTRSVKTDLPRFRLMSRVSGQPIPLLPIDQFAQFAQGPNDRIEPTFSAFRITLAIDQSVYIDTEIDIPYSNIVIAQRVQGHTWLINFNDQLWYAYLYNWGGPYFYPVVNRLP